jgi:hypothetical protein
MPELKPHPEIKPFIRSVVNVFANQIPVEDYSECKIFDQEDNIHKEYVETVSADAKDEFLHEYVIQQLKRIAQHEYQQWMNGEMPFVAIRELQIWRLHQFCKHIWKWNLPSDNDLASIFNITKRKASTLLGDFKAKFWKTYLFPFLIDSMLKFLEQEYDKLIDDDPDQEGGVLGRRIIVPNENYIDNINQILKEPIVVRKIRYHSVRRSKDSLHEIVMWINEDTITRFTTNKNHYKIYEDLKKMYPDPNQIDKA